MYDQSLETRRKNNSKEVRVKEKESPSRTLGIDGSLTKDGIPIKLNLNLLKTPDNVIDYMILHKLCHLKIKENSHHYWDLVKTHMPNY
jgi:predicted metal-dependent hydrolase